MDKQGCAWLIKWVGDIGRKWLTYLTNFLGWQMTEAQRQSGPGSGFHNKVLLWEQSGELGMGLGNLIISPDSNNASYFRLSSYHSHSKVGPKLGCTREVCTLKVWTLAPTTNSLIIRKLLDFHICKWEQFSNYFLRLGILTNLILSGSSTNHYF